MFGFEKEKEPRLEKNNDNFRVVVDNVKLGEISIDTDLIVLSVGISSQDDNEELAKILKISRPTLAQIEKNERELTISQLKQLSEFFDIPLEIILDEKMNLKEIKQKEKEIILQVLDKVQLETSDTDYIITAERVENDYVVGYKPVIQVYGQEYPVAWLSPKGRVPIPSATRQRYSFMLAQAEFDKIFSSTKVLSTETSVKKRIKPCLIMSPPFTLSCKTELIELNLPSRPVFIFTLRKLASSKLSPRRIFPPIMLQYPL